MGSPARREPYGDGVAVVAAGVTTCRGAEESSAQDEGRQGTRLTLMRLREMRRGQRERSGNWRAGCLETSTSGSEEGGWKRAARVVPRQPPILLGSSVQKRTLQDRERSPSPACKYKSVKSQLERPPAITIGSDSAEQNQSPPRGDAGSQLLHGSSPHSSYPK